jgi:hypothetical protein
MQRASGAKEGGQAASATPEERALRLQAVTKAVENWMKSEMARRANPRDIKAQRDEYRARCALFDQTCQLQQRGTAPN